MENAEERRRYPRIANPSTEVGSLPIFVTVPDLLDEPVVPEDFSSGGFKLVTSKRAHAGALLTCTLKVGGVTMEGLQARVAWTAMNDDTAQTWDVGLSVEMPAESRDLVASMLMGLLWEGSGAS